jgi:predicted acetyltransferase
MASTVEETRGDQEERAGTLSDVTDPHDDLAFATLDVGEEGDTVDNRVVGWIEALRRGFHHERPNDDFRTAWLEHARTDNLTIRGAWLREPRVGPGTIPVATYVSFDKTINAGGGLLPLRMITGITVSPTHRRRGLLRRLITDDLQEAADQGVPLAALTVSEGSIYGRFGFGPATHVQHVEVETTARFALRQPLDGAAYAGRIELVQPAEAWEAVQTVFEDFHRTTRGSVARPDFYRPILTASFDFADQAPNKLLRAAVHLDGAGRPDGYVLYRPERTGEHHAIDVVDLVALTPAAYLRIWRFLADHDLVHQVRWNGAPVDDPLEWALVDPHLRKVTKIEDFLWVRVLDVPTALSARQWGADGSVVIEVDDPQGHAAGRWLVRAEGGRATVTRTDDPGIRMAADTLGALYLGGVPVAALGGAGRLAGDDDALDTLAAMADGGPTPYCITRF